MTMTSTSNTATAAVNELASGLADMARDGIFAPIVVGSGGISSDGSKDAIEANHSDYLSDHRVVEAIGKVAAATSKAAKEQKATELTAVMVAVMKEAYASSIKTSSDSLAKMVDKATVAKTRLTDTLPAALGKSQTRRERARVKYETSLHDIERILSARAALKRESHDIETLIEQVRENDTYSLAGEDSVRITDLLQKEATAAKSLAIQEKRLLTLFKIGEGSRHSKACELKVPDNLTSGTKVQEFLEAMMRLIREG